MAYSSKFILTLLNLENCTLSSQDNCYISITIGDQIFKTQPFALSEPLAIQHYTITTSESSGKLQLSKKVKTSVPQKTRI